MAATFTNDSNRRLCGTSVSNLLKSDWFGASTVIQLLSFRTASKAATSSSKTTAMVWTNSVVVRAHHQAAVVEVGVLGLTRH